MNIIIRQRKNIKPTRSGNCLLILHAEYEALKNCHASKQGAAAGT